MNERHLALGLQAITYVKGRIRSGNRAGDKEQDFGPLEAAASQAGKTITDERNARYLFVQDRADAMIARWNEVRSTVQAEIGKNGNSAEKRRELISVVADINTRIAAIHDHVRKFRDETGTTPREDIMMRAVAAIQTGLGNCDEMSSVAYMFLLQLQVTPLDLLVTKERERDCDSHQFVVIGRKDDEALAHPETWSSDAVVCDPWLDAVYPPSQIFERLAAAEYPTDTLFLRLREAPKLAAAASAV